MIRLRPGSTLRVRGAWWQTRARQARVDLTGVTLAAEAQGLPFAVTVTKLTGGPHDFELFAPATETAKASAGTVGSIDVFATFANGDVRRFDAVPVALS